MFDGFILGALGLLMMYDVLLHEQNKFFQWTSDKLTYSQNGHVEDCFIIKRGSFDNMNFYLQYKMQKSCFILEVHAHASTVPSLTIAIARFLARASRRSSTLVSSMSSS